MDYELIDLSYIGYCQQQHQQHILADEEECEVFEIRQSIVFACFLLLMVMMMMMMMMMIMMR